MIASVESIDAETLLAQLSPEWANDLLPQIQSELRDLPRTVVVLDDDPTGTQTVHNVPVLTMWERPLFDELFARGEPIFYILTNSRSLPTERTKEVNRTIAENISASANQFHRAFRIISRSDSTLRGHYPAEVHVLEATLRTHDLSTQAHLIVPCFVEGGRMTIHAVHYLREGGVLMPAAETEFARDKDFGYAHSDLREWVQEKSHGAVRASDVTVIALEQIRRGGPDVVAQRLGAAHGAVVVDAITYRDLDVLVAALLQLERYGHNFLFRTAASFVRAYAGMGPRPLLTRPELVADKNQRGGLIVVGSYTDKTTRQVETLQNTARVHSIELRVDLVLEEWTRDAEIRRVAQETNNALARGDTTLVYTSRVVVSAESHLEIGQRVSDALASVAAQIETSPRYLIAKGGITSSDVATHGLKVRRALVLGQIQPGVPVWQLGQESRFPNLPYIVFPGNVGQDSTLADIVAVLAQEP